MLLKNGKEWNILADENAEELKAFLAHIPPFNQTTPVVLKFDRSLVYWDKVNGKEHKPAGRGIPYRQVVNRIGPERDETNRRGNETWVYCKNYEAHAATGTILTRTPWRLMFEGRMTITWENIDLAFFLYLSPSCGNGENKKQTATYVFEDKESEAREAIDLEKIEARVKALILNGESDNGLSDEKIQEFAAAYQVPGNPGIFEARRTLFMIVKTEGMKGYNRFMSLMGDPQEKERLMMIKTAKDLGILVCTGLKIEKGTGNNQCWKIMTREGEVAEIIAKHKKSQGQRPTDHDHFLSQAFEQDPSLYNRIKAIINVAEVLV